MELVLMAAATSNSSNLFNIIGNMSCALSFLFDNDNWQICFQRTPTDIVFGLLGRLSPILLRPGPNI